ncbi:MAG TPA: hypothetical protein VED87_03925 [Methylocystis sp.]|nr:hypothetical protein [Methylocystis sp.]
MLATAAAQTGHEALAQAARAQTALAFTAIAALAVYFAFRGFTNPRLRRWTQLYWICGLLLVFVAPSLFPSLTPAHIDYALTFWVGQRGRDGLIAPGDILLARAGLGAAIAAFAGLCAHDAAHRLREALWELGLMDVEEEDLRRAAPGAAPGAVPGGGPQRERAGRAREGEPDNDAPSFGHRKEVSETAWAFAALGLRSGASRSEIERAYRARMKRAHPDHGGSAQAAARLNQARDLLLPHGRR